MFNEVEIPKPSWFTKAIDHTTEASDALSVTWSEVLYSTTRTPGRDAVLEKIHNMQQECIELELAIRRLGGKL